MIVVLLFCLVAPAAGAQDFSGAFAGAGVQVELQRIGENEYAGSITVKGTKMPARGSFDAVKGFHGTFEASGAQFPFSLKRDGDMLTLTSGATSYVLVPAGGGQANAPAPNDRAQGIPAANALPAFLKPGMRITFHEGSAVVAGVNRHLVEEKPGQWVDPATGKQYNEKENMNSGGVGYVQLDVVAADADFVAADARSYLIDTATGACQFTNGGSVVGNAAALGEYWVHPGVLAQKPEGNAGGVKTNRVTYEIGGRRYNALSITSNTANSFISHVYDLESGLLLARSGSNTGEDVPVLGQHGQTHMGKGKTYTHHARFVSTRQTNAPWAGDAAPAWAAAGKTIAYRGGVAPILRQTPGLPNLPPLPPTPIGVAFTIDRVNKNAVVAKLTTRTELGQGIPPQETTVQRCYGPTSLAGLWVSPAALGQLKPNQPIDQDPVTRFALSFAGLQGRVAVFNEQGPMENTQYAYDAQSGMLVGVRSLRQAGPNQMQVQFDWTGQ